MSGTACTYPDGILQSGRRKRQGEGDQQPRRAAERRSCPHPSRQEVEDNRHARQTDERWRELLQGHGELHAVNAHHRNHISRRVVAPAGRGEASDLRKQNHSNVGDLFS